jgi:hypothetical protein
MPEVRQADRGGVERVPVLYGEVGAIELSQVWKTTQDRVEGVPFLRER